MNTTLSPFSPSDAGCWLDSHRGWTAYPAIIDIAVTEGFELPDDVQEAWSAYTEPASTYHSEWEEFWQDRDDMHDICDMAEAYLNDLAPEGFYFGSSEQGDWGLWPIEVEE